MVSVIVLLFVDFHRQNRWKRTIDEFIGFAAKHPELFFYVTRVGCGIAGFRDSEIAPLFAEAMGLSNVALPKSFIEYLK